MTATERAAMSLATSDAGMMIFQTTPNKGNFTFDGTNWCGLVAGTVSGATLKWDDTAKSWMSVTNLFNSGSSIGIGTQSPKTQFHINSSTNVATTRIQITNPTTGYLTADGFLMGISYANGDAHIIQQENKALFFSTNSAEKMRIDSAGNVGIGNIHPQAKLDVNGAVKIGQNGTPISCIMKSSVMVDVPLILAGLTQIVNVTCPNVVPSATVHISPGEEMDDIMICYARVSALNNIEIKFMNLSVLPLDQNEMMFYITVIQ